MISLPTRKRESVVRSMGGLRLVEKKKMKIKSVSDSLRR